MLQMFQPMVLAMTAGSMVGHLAQRTFGQYDLPIPRPLTGPASDELLLVVPNLDAFAREWSLAPDDLRLWICVHEVAAHAVLGVPHVRARLDDLLTSLRVQLPQRPLRAGGPHRRHRPRRPVGAGQPAGGDRIARGDPRRHHVTGAGGPAPGPGGDRGRGGRRGRPRGGRGRRRAHHRLPDAHRGAPPPTGGGRGGRPLRRAALRPRAHPGHLRPRQRVREAASSSARATRACAASGRATSSSPPSPRSTPPASGSPASSL